jgi:pimeloyl-ACP methyl ester carboxylesterase
MKRPACALLFLVALPWPGRLPAAEAPKDITPGEALVLPPVGRYGRGSVTLDPVEALMVAGKWAAPKAGDTVGLPDGKTAAWQAAKVGPNGSLGRDAVAGRYVYFAIPSDAERVMVLEVSGHLLAYFNGEPRAADPYGYGYVHLPVALRKGTNDLLVIGSPRAERGVHCRLVAPKAAAQLDLADVTQPDLIAGEATDTHAALPVLNATAATLDGLTIEATIAGGQPVATPLPSLPPLSTRKAGFVLQGPAPEKDGECVVELRLLKKGQDKPLDTATLKLGVRKAGQSYKRTFISDIDGSVQYYAVQPARPAEGAKDAPALVLTLHGAAVEAIGQANAYGGKSWAHIVAPTNRRPYGFDWEDWGRLDALEVLKIAKTSLNTDPRRTYLTGHSMGGHGTWQVGLTFPDRFAAIAPSAGWVSFASYAGAAKPGQMSPVQELVLRAANPSDTLALARNAAGYGVYVLHGEADDNVPVGQARAMRGVLGGFHPDFAYYERPGARHWWGNECVDWPPLFDFLARHTLPKPTDVRKVEFVTASPGVSARCYWATIEAQQHALKFSRVEIACDPDKRRFSGKSENVARLAIDLAPLRPGQPLSVELDGQKVEKIDWPEKARLWLARDGDKWSVTKEPAPSLKGPHRYGPFKEAFRNRMLFVYGTQGTREENAWALARARFDAETFWYRGNGSVDVVPDTDAAALADHDRGVILYGNADTNAAWKPLLGDSPVQVRRGRVTVGDREEKGDGLACLFLRPRPNSDRACVAAVAGSGASGMRLTERRAYFQSGSAYPDCLVLDAGALGAGGDGVLGAGFFGTDWGLASGEFAWKK